MEGILMSCVVTLLFLVVLWLEPRRFSGMILLVLAVCAWIITIMDLLDDAGAVFGRTIAVLGVVMLPLTILGTGIYMLFYGQESKKNKKNFVLLKSIGYLLVLGVISAGVWALAWFSYVRYEYHQFELFRRTMTAGDYIIDFFLLWFWLAVITAAFTVFGFWLYSVLLCRAPKSKEYNYIILHGDGRQKGDVGGPLADYLDRAIALHSQCCSSDSRYMIFGRNNPGEKRSEAKMMADYLLEKGVPKNLIMINESISGAKNALVASKKYLDRQRIPYQAVMLTRDCLVFRMNLYARKAKMDLVPVGFKFSDNTHPMEFLREYVIVMMWYRWLLIGWLLIGTAGIIGLLAA